MIQVRSRVVFKPHFLHRFEPKQVDAICPMSRSTPYFLKSAVWFIVFVLLTGCAADEDKRKEIKEKVRAGEHDEAVRLAHEYLGDDKRVLLVMLEYIAYEKGKAVKEAYKKNVVIEDVDWSTDSSGVTAVVGRLLNRGDKTVTGIGIRIACIREGKTVRGIRATYPDQIPPGASKVFQRKLDGFTDCHDLSIHIIDLGLKDW
jgi:hypothetical protein